MDLGVQDVDLFQLESPQVADTHHSNQPYILTDWLAHQLPIRLPIYALYY